MHPTTGYNIAFSLVIGALIIALGANCRTAPKPKEDGRHARQIYDMQAEGDVQLQAALSRAKDQDKRVLLSLGANWCSDSQKTYDVLRDNETLKGILDQHYVVALVDVNDRIGGQRNPEIVERYDVDLKRGIPALLVLDPDGTLLTTDPDTRPRDYDHYNPHRLEEYLNTWANTSGTDSESK